MTLLTGRIFLRVTRSSYNNFQAVRLQKVAIASSRPASTFFQKPLNYIDGERVAPNDTAQQFKVVQPSTGWLKKFVQHFNITKTVPQALQSR